jgi:hypothetical protein
VGKNVEKSGSKSGRKPGTFVGGAADPRAGRGPKKGAPNAGRPPDEFKAMMRQLASKDETIARLRDILSGAIPMEREDGSTVDVPVDSDTYLKALAFVTDRGYGKAQQHLDVTSGGESLTRDQIAAMSVAQLRAEIAARLARA